MKTYALSILTPSGAVLDQDKVTFLVAPALNGNMGVLADHAPTVTALLPGKLRVETEDEKYFYDIEEGVLEVLPNHNVIILTAGAKKAETEVVA